MVMRKCQACGAIKDQKELIKITLEHKTKLPILNPTTKETGKSVYVCKNESCVKLFIKKKTIARLLKCNKTEEIAQIEAKLSNMLW